MGATAALHTMLNANVMLSIGLFAVFVAWNPNPPNTTGNCTYTDVMADRFVTYGVVSFSCMMFSIFIVLFLQLSINRINVYTLYFWMFLASFAQVNAFLFLILVVPIGLTIEFGTLICATAGGSSSSGFHILAVSLSLYILFPIAFLYYISLLRYSLTR